MTDEATPRPWQVGDIGRCIIRPVPDIADGHDHYMIAVLSVHSLINIQEAKANAALIVRAVNERDELIGALSAFIGRVMNAQIDMSTGKTKAQVDAALTEAIRDARTTLAKVKAG